METATVMLDIAFWACAGLLLHSYFVYPLLAILLGGRRKPTPLNDLPAVSMLVPAHNEAAVIERKMENFRSLDYPTDRIELIVADDGSRDDTAAIVQRHLCNRSRLIKFDARGGKANAMNELVRMARHSLLLMTDANVMLHPDAVRKLVQHFGDERVGSVTGEVRLHGSNQEFVWGENLYYLLERRIQRAESRIGSVMGVDGGMYLLRRELFQPLPTDTILDDFLVSMLVIRARYRVLYESDARANEGGTSTAKEEYRRRIRIAAGAIQLLKRGYVPRFNQPLVWFQFFSHKLLRWFSPVLLSILLCTNILLVSQHWVYQLTMIVQSVGYLALLTPYLLPPVRKTSLGSLLFYTALGQLGMTIGFFRGLLNRQPPQWDKGRRIEEITGSR